MNMTSLRLRALVCVSLLAVVRYATAESEKAVSWPDDYVTHENSISPDGRFGILVPSREMGTDDVTSDLNNFVGNLKTHHVLGKIDDADYFERQNHRGLTVVWAPDSSACVLTYEARFGYDTALLLELKGSSFTQTDLGKHIDKSLAGAVGEIGTNSVWFRFAPDGRIRARALTYTGNPKLMDKETKQARFTGTYDRAAKKWSASESRRTKDWDAFADAYSAREGADIFVAPNGDQSKVPPDFTGSSVNSEEEKEKALDQEMNAVYGAVKLLSPPAKFAKVKQEQIAWLKKRDAIPVGQRSELIIARIKALEEFLWE
jgi:hypothetical protein